MNYLAHLLLAQPNPYSLTGNLMGDFYRGIDIDRLPEAMLKGLENHRLVDRFTDRDNGVKGLREILSADKRRFSGIIADITFDYFLIKHWGRFTDQNFDQFVDMAYKGLLECREYMPEHMQQTVVFMASQDWLRSYRTLEGIGYVMDRVSGRIRFKNTMLGAITEVENHYQEFESVFLDLFPRLQSHVNTRAVETR